MLEFDYLTTQWLIVLLLFTPLLITKTKLDFITIYIWIYAVIYSRFPVVFESYSKGVQFATINSQNELLTLIAVLVLIVKTKFNAKAVLKIFGIISLSVSFFASILTNILCLFPNTKISLINYIIENQRWISGLVVNKSMNGILISALLPFILSRATFVLSLIVIVLSRSTSAYLSFFACGLYLYLGNTDKSRADAKRLKWWGLVGMLALAIFILTFDKDVFIAGQRLIGYQFFFSDFSIKDILIGKGPGSFWAISTYRQKHEDFEMANGFFFWLHSDPLQYIFEYGILGLIPLFASIIKPKDYKVIASILALVAGSFFYYPFHFPIHLIVLFMVLKLAYEKG